MNPKTPILAILVVALLVPLTVRAADVPLVFEGSVWKYLDNGIDPGTAWRNAAFDDSSWPSGPAQLGYGDGDEGTIVSYGADPANRHPTTYFRQSFVAPDPSLLTTLRLRVVRDDGAIVYINGAEVWRLNMPDGAVTSRTFATSTVSDADEDTYQELVIPTSSIAAGTNTVAVEVHQAYASSSDLSFALELIGEDDVVVPSVTRGPYLQLGTPSSIIVRWRTDTPSDSRVNYGASPSALTEFADDSTLTTEHEVRLTGLTPYTRYYYSVGTSSAPIVGGTNEYTFLTAPSRGQAVNTRIWVLGDSGTAGSGARMVRNAFYGISPTPPNLWLMLGDNAYSNGLDAEYQNAVFNMYPEMLRKSVLWPTIGNHDTANSHAASTSYPYYNIFTLPKNAEAGGVASGTESYYSFDYGNIHFICLDSMTSNRSTTGPMLTWLRNDLASTSSEWLIAFWHHPPYTKGSHDSDWEDELIEMRENALPILEEAGVDLVLAGHSHSYERSYLIDGHYGYSESFVSSMKMDGGDGNTTPYHKPTRAGGAHEGAVYATAGSSGTTSPGPLNHPAMVVSLQNLGSMLLKINGDTLEGKFIREDGSTADQFTIVKGSASPTLTATAVSSSQVDLTWTGCATNVERCTGAGCTSFASIGTGSGTYSDTGLTSGTLYRYRVDTAISEATTFATLTATAVSSSQINLSWTGSATSVERCSGAGCTSFVSIGTGSGTYSDTGLTSDTLYRYRVGTVIAEATTFATLTATAVSSSQVDLTWTGSATNVERCSGAGCTSFVSIGTGSGTYSDTGLTSGTLYRYRVGTAIAEATTFATLTATAVSSSQVDLTWTGSATSVERCSGAGCTSFVSIGTGSGTYSDTGLNSGTLYRYRVGTAIAEATTFATLTAIAVSASQINLTWTGSATSVERCSGAGCTSFASIGTGSGTYSDSGLTSGTLYRYRVDTAIAEATTFATLTATAVSSSQINLTWTGSATNVERCTGAGCTSFVSIGTSSGSYSDTGLASGTLYRYRVGTVIAEATTFATLTATAISPTQINLSWTGSATTVERCTGAGCTSFVSIGTSSGSYSDTGLASGTLYRYRVGTVIAEATTLATLTATAVSSSQINVTWTGSATTVERCTGAGCTSFVSIGTSSGSYSDSGLASGTLYRYRVGTLIAEATTFATLTATAVSSSQINLTWTGSATSVERCSGAGCTSFVSIGTGSGTYPDTGLSSGTLYRYRVGTVIAEATTFATLTATVVSASQVNLTWTGSATTVERCTGAGCTNFVSIGTSSGSYSDTGLASGTLYRYRVGTLIAEATTFAILTATAISPTQINLTWTGTATTVERCTGAGCTNFVAIGTSTTNAFSNTGLASGVLYRYRVGTAISEATTFAILTATAISPTQISLTWTGSATIVERCTGAGCTNFAVIATSTTSSYANTGLASGVLYRYRVGTAISEATTFAILTATAISPTQISLTWTGSATIVERCTGAGCTNFVSIGKLSASYSDTGLASGVLYRYRVGTAIAEATTFATLTATAISPTQISLTWTGTATTVERCTGAGCTNFVAIATSTTNAFSNTGLTSGVLYRYRVGSVIAEATTFATLTATAISPTQINLTWTGTATTIDRCTGTGCTNFAAIATSTTKAFSNTGLAPNTLYRYRVGNSNIAEARTLDVAPAAPGSLAATNITGSSVTLTWTDNANNETGFRIERCSGSTCTNFAQIAVVGANVRAYFSGSMRRGTYYRYRIRAYNSAGTSAYSNIVRVKTK